MILTLDIERNAKPIIRNLFKESLTRDKNLKENIDDLILIIEGFINHIPELNKHETKNLLDKTKKISKNLIEVDEKLILKKYLGSEEIKSKYQYLLKTISGLKSLLHISYTKDVVVKETPVNLKEALSGLSRESVFKAISKS